MRRFLRPFLVVAALILVVMAGSVWWFVYRPLPQLDGTVPLEGLRGEVRVDRDAWGVPHIHAGSLEDMVEAQGYVLAQDRLWQMDLLRRAASGELAEILGASVLPLDRAYRTLGLRQAAERDAQTVDAESKAAFEAYARGVNRYIEQHANRLPLEFSLLRYRPRPWRPADSLVIAGYMYQTLTNTWRRELNRAKVTARVGEDRAKELYVEESDMDRFVVGGEPSWLKAEQKSRKRTNADDEDDKIESQALVKTRARREHPAPAGRLRSSLPEAPGKSVATSQVLPNDAFGAAMDFLEEFGLGAREGIGSNNWVVNGAHTASGKPLLANDTHLELGVPSIWYLIHLTAPGWNVKGFTLPGAPLVIIGHNDRIAWGFTNTGADVQDLYIESFNPANPAEYRVNGQWKKAEVRHETIRVKGRLDESLEVVVTRHGPVVLREGAAAYALRWTALEPGGLGYTYNWLGRTKDWSEFRNEMRRVWGPAQNAVFADVDGNIGYVVGARVPVRKKGRGEVPVPGDTDDYEWTGYIPFDEMPQAFNPPDGIIATANARVAGPRYKYYLTDRWASPYRTARIYDLLERKGNLRPADFLTMQTDVYSFPHVFMAEQLLSASKIAQPKDGRARELLGKLNDWNGQARADGVEPSFLEAARSALLRMLLEPYLGEQTDLYDWRGTVFLQNALKSRPQRWLPPGYKNYDELLMAAADRAVAELAKASGSAAVKDWTWGRFNALQMHHAIRRPRLLHLLLGNVGNPQSGTLFSVRAAQPSHGPAMRFVADLADWDKSLMVVTTGESGQVASTHYLDLFPFWFDGKPLEAPFSQRAEDFGRKHQLVLRPGE